MLGTLLPREDKLVIVLALAATASFALQELQCDGWRAAGSGAFDLGADADPASQKVWARR